VRFGNGGLLGRAGLCGLALWLSCFVSGCTRAPTNRFNLESLKVRGNDNLDDEEIEERIASRETPRFLGLFPGFIYDYEVFNRFVLERDLQRIERLYQSRGYYKARARAAHVFRSGSKVRVEIVVDEGKPVLLRRVDLHGVERLPRELQQVARTSVTDTLPLNEPFEEEKLQAAAKVLANALGDAGYAKATVRKSADVNLPDNVAAAGFWVDAGEPCELGSVTLQGLADLPEDRVRGALSLKPGDAYSQSEIDEAKRALLDLGVFSSVEIEPQVEQAQPGPNQRPRIPILVKLEKAKLRSVHMGGGVLIDSLKSDVHLSFGWEDQSFMGGMRKLQLELVPGVVLYPTRFPTFQAPERLLPQGRFSAGFRQPGFLTGRTNLLMKGQVSAYPVLLSPDHDPKSPIIGYRDYRASVGFERTLRRFYGLLSQNLQINDPFSYYLALDEDLGRVVVSYPAFLGSFDLRDDRVHPHRGWFIQNELQVAGVGGDAQDVKVQPEVRVYLPITKRATLAARGTIGLLFAGNYGGTVESNALTGEPGPGATRSQWIRDIQIMFLRGFFSGGAGSNRGYAAREIGPHGNVPFYNHGQSSDSLDDEGEVDCDAPPSSATYNAAVCDLPLGGFTLWEAGLELRYPLAGALSGTVFTDTSDVSPRPLSFRFTRLHLSVGAGLRYDTPVGPVRFDLGFRVPGMQAPKDAADEGVPGTIFGAPLAASFGIGEAF
jgi:outer membrane protein insertion porin family/translocation and assembly module TamA